ncbi:hypothetical protein ACFV4P_03015 [Kitasatospora sp. NPDC059795]|uniref:hypothetical protein n=1 Tax=Kitasatospora sp. NPDC059795 TaxID=3346949 RepID=UPI0036646CD8
MSEQTPAEQPGPDADDQPHSALDGLSNLLATPPWCGPDWSPAGPRRSTARSLGHLDLNATRAYAKPEDDQP